MITNQNKRSKKIINRGAFWIALLIIVAIVGFSYATINSRLGEGSLIDQPTYEVQQGPLTISIAVSGTIQPRETIVLQSELEGQNAILFLVPEGARVKQGELLIELDASTLQDNLVDQQIRVQNAEAAYINARENLAIVENQAQSDIDAAELVYKFAIQDLRQYLEGEFPKQEKEYQQQIAVREEELNQAQNDLKWSDILFKEKYLSESELKKAEISTQKTKLSLDMATADLGLLKDFTFHRQVAKLTSDVTQAEMALERTQRKASANIVQASTELQAKKAEWDQQINKLKKMQDQISKAKIYAPMDGLVVYAASARRGGFRFNEEPLDIGQTVRERQELLRLPTTSSYVVEVKIHESSLDKVRVDLPVRITVDALPGKVFTGKVASIAPLPDSQSMFMNQDIKVYNTQIYVDGNGDELRSGMSCQAKIIVDQFKDALYIPVLAVLRVGGKHTVYVVKGNTMEPREVELGPDNNRLAQIKSGLEKGEKVLLTPPLASAAVMDEKYDEEFVIPEKKETISESAGLKPSTDDSDLTNRPPDPGAEAPGARMRGPGGEGRPDFQNMTPEQQEQARQRFMENMTPEQREQMEQMRKRFESMTPEQREEAMRQRGGGGQLPGFGGEGRGGGRSDSQNLTPEQQEERRQRFQNMTPEEREQRRQQRAQQGQGQEQNRPRGGNPE
ncbi:MAG: efflux RND transporter periplasmic adaptor subunit [Candidatus Omnitrophota bacterium]|jgi:HlyD family secretion protein|nr:MAG: efflux RND transporter periplasmic adaptor subunit [Candidatus Omnitrophota bacterium]